MLFNQRMPRGLPVDRYRIWGTDAVPMALVFHHALYRSFLFYAFVDDARVINRET
jgi:hypothetical protein